VRRCRNCCDERRFNRPRGSPRTRCRNAGDRAPLRALARRQPLVLPPQTSLRELLYQISQGQEDAAVIADTDSGLPLGLITLRALLHIISFERVGLEAPVAAHMIGAPLRLAADASIHRAKVLMAKRGVRHLLLTEPDGRLFGLIEHADLLGLRGEGTDVLVESIAAARDIDAMLHAADQVRRRGAELFHGGMAVEALCLWMSGLNDLIGMRICELVEDEHDLPAVSWCWIVFGSEGRLEQTFATDQDNGLLFVPPSPEATDAVRSAFLPFAQAVNDALHYCGFERCSGKIMAGNPDWCLSADEWRRRFANWLRLPDPEGVLHGTIFFDFRPLYGDFEPVDQLRSWLAGEAPDINASFARWPSRRWPYRRPWAGPGSSATTATATSRTASTSSTRARACSPIPHGSGRSRSAIGPPTPRSDCVPPAQIENVHPRISPQRSRRFI
jgi:CBS domain-containing protein